MAGAADPLRRAGPLYGTDDISQKYRQTIPPTKSRDATLPDLAKPRNLTVVTSETD